MELHVNGERRETPDGLTVAGVRALVVVRGVGGAVVVNGGVVRRAEHERHGLAAGDRIEVVAFVGGGT